MIGRRVTAIVPAFNSQSTVLRALDSIGRQTLVPSEIVVVDDASDDSTARILESWSPPAGSAYRVIKLPRNGGVANARNVGWNYAVGSIIAFLDSDDTWPVWKNQLQCELLERAGGAAMIGGRAVEGWGVNSVCCNLSVRTCSLSRLLVRNRFNTPTVMLRKDIDFRFPTDWRYAEDYALWCDLAASGERVLECEQALAITHKPKVGVAGLSARVWEMEQGMQRVYQRLREKRKIGRSCEVACRVWSFVRFLRRVSLVKGGLL